jgi:dihydroorotate dehydrogenase electron transfer subunit
MTTLKPGDQLDIIGPLGNGFSVPADKSSAILIAGGMGSPPLQHLAEYLRGHHPDISVVVFAGARSLDDFPFTVQASDDGTAVPVEFARLGDRACVATDDGSAGFHGLVTELAAQWLDENVLDPNETIIYGCGPEVMLAAVAGLAAEHGIDCQVSMERMMGCGIGLCQSCAVLTAPDAAGETMYKLCCKDGPVFDSKDVSFRL